MISFASRAHCVHNEGCLKLANEAVTYFLPVLQSQRPWLIMLQENPKFLLECLTLASKCIHAPPPPRPERLEWVYLEPWVLAGSSKYPGVVLQFEALTDLNMSTGAGTDRNSSPWLSATFNDTVVVECVEVGMGLTGHGWQPKYLHGAEIQYRCDGQWHTVAKVSTENGSVNKLRTGYPVVASEWRVIRHSANCYLGLSHLRFYGCRLHASSV